MHERKLGILFIKVIVSEMACPEYCCVVPLPGLLEDGGPGVDDEEVGGQRVQRDVDEVVGAGAAAGEGVVQPEGRQDTVGNVGTGVQCSENLRGTETSLGHKF